MKKCNNGCGNDDKKPKSQIVSEFFSHNPVDLNIYGLILFPFFIRF
jgi:hypothetical protein